MSVFHLFADIAAKKAALKTSDSLDQFPFDSSFFLCTRKGKFPDYILRLNGEHEGDQLLQGGELIELKDIKNSYTIASL